MVVDYRVTMTDIKGTLSVIFWEREMKYVSISELALLILAGVLWISVSPIVSMVVVATLMLLLVFCTQTYWIYRDLKSDDDVDNPLRSAIIMEVVVFIVGSVGSVALIVLVSVLSALVGFSLFIPTMFLLFAATIVSLKWLS